LKQLKLKLAINKYLAKWGDDYSTNVFGVTRVVTDLDLYHSVVDEMEREGMLIKKRSKLKALILSYRELPS
jgi:hypothetical protein